MCVLQAPRRQGRTATAHTWEGGGGVPQYVQSRASVTALTATAERPHRPCHAIEISCSTTSTACDRHGVGGAWYHSTVA